MDKKTRDIVEEIIRMIMSQKGISQAAVAREVDMLPQAFNNFLKGNLTQIVRFIAIAGLCDYDIILKNKYLEINLSEAVRSAEDEQK